MYYSTIAQILYIIIMIVSLGLTLAGLLTPNWRKISHLDPKYNQYIPKGLFPSTCMNQGNETALRETCVDWLNAQPLWNELVIGGLLLSITIQLFAVIWSFIGFCSCRCCKECFHFALPGLSSAASVFIITALIIFGIHNPDAIDDFGKIFKFKPPKVTNTISYSYYITVAAVICNFIAIGIGIYVSLWNQEIKQKRIKRRSERQSRAIAKKSISNLNHKFVTNIISTEKL